MNATIAGANATDVWYKIDALTEVQLPNIGGENYGATIDTGALTEGAHTIQIIAYDAAGNVNDTESVGITVDLTLPEVNITSAEATVRVNYELTVKITDANIDTQNLSYNIDDGTPVTLNLVLGDDYNAIIDISGLSDDQHTIKIIAYDLAKASDVELAIYNITGQWVATLVSEPQRAGHYQVAWDGSSFGNGVYVYRLTTGEYSETKRMVLLR